MITEKESNLHFDNEESHAHKFIRDLKVMNRTRQWPQFGFANPLEEVGAELKVWF